MKRSINLIALFVASLFITAGVWAQTVKATIPFNWTVDGTNVPAGTYTITSMPTDHHILEIRNGGNSVHILSMALDDSAKGKDNVLVFHKVGDQYFLSEILCDWAGVDVVVHPSKVEKRVLLQQAMVHPSSEVFIAAR